MRREWFHAFLSSDGCKFKLSNLPECSWLVRFSLKTPKGFAISLLLKNEEIRHWNVSPTNNPENGKELSVQDTDKTFSNIKQAVEYYQKNNLPNCEFKLEHMCFSLEGKISLGKKLGGGNFGEVFLAVWNRQNGPMNVAAKSLQEVKDEKTKDNQKEYDEEHLLKNVEIVSFSKEFEAEANLLKSLNHINVVQFFGVCVLNEVQYIITEFMDKGSVLSFLEKKAKTEISPLLIVKIAQDSAKGMGYLAERGIVHRDLAARNLLISQPDESKQEYNVKVTDFGLGRKVEKGKYYQKSFKTGDPVKWAAPETFKPITGKDVFQGKVSERSDRWSYGIVLFELFDFCRGPPYPELGNPTVKGLLSEKSDMTEHLPIKDAPDGIKEIMKDCLSYDSHARPDFPTIAGRLEKIIQDLTANPSKNVWKVDIEAASTKTEEENAIAIKTTYDDDDDETKESEYDAQQNEE